MNFFPEFDEDGDGTIDQKELEIALGELLSRAKMFNKNKDTVKKAMNNKLNIKTEMK